MIESCIVIVFLCLLFLGLFQLLHAYVVRDVLYHAAARAARAKTVGFNRWMVEKTMRVAAIPNAGSLTEPVLATSDQTLANALATMKPGALWDFALQSTPQSSTLAVELARLPVYLESQDRSTADNILNYANWDTIPPPTISSSSSIAIDPASAGTITALVQQPYDLLISMAALWAGDLSIQGPATNKTLGAVYTIEANYPLYLNDNNW